VVRSKNKEKEGRRERGGKQGDRRRRVGKMK